MTHLVLYDGVCGLCDHFVQFLIKIDRTDRLRFAALQGELGGRLLKEAGRNADALSTVVVIADYGTPSARWLERSDAALFAIASVGGVYRVMNVLRLVPRFFRDAAYLAIARSRYRIFGRFDSCPVPTPATRARFLDLVTRP